MKTTLKFGILFLACLTASCLDFHLAEGTPLEHEVAAIKTPLFGTDKIGSAFSWTTSLQNADIREISGRDDWYINQIKVRTEDGAHEETSPSFGENEGGGYTWKVPDGEYITKIEYRQGSWLDGITFITSKGTRSPQFGGNGGNGPFTYTLPVGTKLNGFYGFKDKHIRGLGFTYRFHSTLSFGASSRGSSFSWMSSLYNAEIREVIGKNSWRIGQIKVKTSDGAHEEISPTFGEGGGEAYRWVVPNGEYILRIEYNVQGSQLYGITFVTDKGTRSPHFGGHGGNERLTYYVPARYRLAGLFGYKDHYIRSLGFHLAPARRMNKKLPVYGNYNSGTKYQWVAGNNDGNVETIQGRAGWYIDKIKFYLTNGEASPAFGGNGGFAYRHTIPAGQHIVSATFKTGDWLDSVTFKTSGGSTFKIGGNGGSTVHTENIPEGANVVGFYGTYNGSHFLSLGLIIAQYF